MLKKLLIAIALFSILGAFAVAQENPEVEKKEAQKHPEKMIKHDHNKMKEEMKDHSVHGNTKMQEEESIVRKAKIDLNGIDENGDGMVYQDQMCWNVISDEAGECPQCGMILKEVSLEKAKENLKNNDYQVK